MLGRRDTMNVQFAWSGKCPRKIMKLYIIVLVIVNWSWIESNSRSITRYSELFKQNKLLLWIADIGWYMNRLLQAYYQLREQEVRHFFQVTITQNSAGHIMVTVFWDAHWILFIDYFGNTTMKGEWYYWIDWVKK